MGNQIRFFMLEEDFVEFCNFIRENKDVIVDRHGQLQTISEIQESIYNVMYIIPHESNITFRNDIVDAQRSYVIEFSKCDIKNNNLVRYGRLWIETKYWSDTGELITKDKWLTKKYNVYKKWIQKNFKASTGKDFYIGKVAEKLYREEGYKLMSTPKYEVELD